ncbi:hypothetical protein AAFF_G00030340 [Aldrovandia affinis]|uniref:Aquaporin 7 n=1 Tax=Aldrovandia affinis TaxID=143900 RepID=A0AAD7S4A5_9TELE|nr:hypothetical protein AAFF_G00030340 [Aldrovandia affinis]
MCEREGEREKMKDTLNSMEEEQTGGRIPFTFRIKNESLRVALAETLSTYVMMTFGLGTVAQVVTGGGVFGDYLSINLGFGLGVAMGVHIAGTVSGAHMNAAVSFTMCMFGRLRWKMFPLYLVAQLLGSFLAAGTVFSVYYDAMFHYCAGNFTVTGPRATAGIFSTYPAPYLSIPAGFLDQVLGTAMLLLCLMALSDQRNKPALPGAEPMAVGLLVLLIGVSWGATAAMPSTRPGTWLPDASLRWPAGEQRSSGQGTAGGGCPWWRPWLVE